jgi:hypothetical protein
MNCPKLLGTQATFAAIYFRNLWVLSKQENEEVQYYCAAILHCK